LAILPSNFEEVATGVLKVLNNMARLDITLLQHMLVSVLHEKKDGCYSQTEINVVSGVLKLTYFLTLIIGHGNVIKLVTYRFQA
jgi:hypothetical protein